MDRGFRLSITTTHQLLEVNGVLNTETAIGNLLQCAIKKLDLLGLYLNLQLEFPDIRIGVYVVVHLGFQNLQVERLLFVDGWISTAEVVISLVRI